MSNVTSLLTKINAHSGFAKANRFKVIITPPTTLGKLSEEESSFIEFTVESATLPGRTIATSDHQDAFESHKAPYTFIDDEVVIGFILTNDYKSKKLFDEWQQLIFNTSTYTLGYKDDYKGIVEIWQIGDKGRDSSPDNKLYGTKLINAFPTIVSPVELSTGSENTISRFSVTFAYDRFEVL